MKTLAEKIAVMQAAERGETIEYQTSTFLDAPWCPIEQRLIAWNWQTCDYRVKPKPLCSYRLALCKNNRGFFIYIVMSAYDEKFIEGGTYFVRWITDWVDVYE